MDGVKTRLCVNILSSGSGGNCYTFNDGKATIQVECGLSAQRTLTLLDHRLPDAILLTHEHKDHSFSVKNFLERGVDVYMTAGTANSLKLNRHNLHLIREGESFEVCGHKVLPITSEHDAAEPVNFIFDDEILFITDTGDSPAVHGRFRIILVEANYERMKLFAANTNSNARRRILQNHMSVTQTIDFLKQFDEPEQVWLIHLSKRHGDARQFVQAVRQKTGFKNVYVGGLS